MLITNSPDTVAAFNDMNMNIQAFNHACLSSEWNFDYDCTFITRIYMIIKGEGKLIFSNKTITMKPGKIYIIPAGLPFSGVCDNYLEKLYVHVSIPNADGFDLLTPLKECTVIENGQKTVNECLDIFKSNKKSDILHLKSILYSLIDQCTDAKKEHLGETENYSVLVSSAIEIIENELSNTLSAAYIAKKLFISPSKLQKQFRHDVGISLGKFVDSRLMFVAEKELRRKEKTIKEISEMLGFCDQFYFSRKFSATYGMSPKHYKNQCRI